VGDPDREDAAVLKTPPMPTEERIARVTGVLSRRQPDLRVVLENITNVHNANAVLRTCDAAGVLNVDVIGADAGLFEVNKAITTRADKWLNLAFHAATRECLAGLKAKNLKIVVTHLSPTAVDYAELDYAQPVAIVFGNESDGISAEALEMADAAIRVPMLGMAQSLNLSVSAGVILYEALRQRRAKGYFEEKRLSDEEFEALKKKWLG
jgi:tRNA (guanosine-2'-O-)-methyltransferase